MKYYINFEVYILYVEVTEIFAIPKQKVHNEKILILSFRVMFSSPQLMFVSWGTDLVNKVIKLLIIQ